MRGQRGGYRMAEKILTKQQRRLLGWLASHAERDLPCPSNGQIAEFIGSTSTTAASVTLSRLSEAGYIEIARGQAARIVTIIASGKSTAGTISMPHRPRGAGSVPGARTTTPRASTAIAPRPMSHSAATTLALPRVDRDPCPRCGTRRDLGCGCRLPGIRFVPAALFRGPAPCL